MLWEACHHSRGTGQEGLGLGAAGGHQHEVPQLTSGSSLLADTALQRLSSIAVRPRKLSGCLPPLSRIALETSTPRRQEQPFVPGHTQPWGRSLVGTEWQRDHPAPHTPLGLSSWSRLSVPQHDLGSSVITSARCPPFPVQADHPGQPLSQSPGPWVRDSSCFPGQL